MSPTPGRGNLRARTAETRLTTREQEELRPGVSRLAAKGYTYQQIAEALSTPQQPLTKQKIRRIQLRFNIPPGVPIGRPRDVPDRAGDRSGTAIRIAEAAANREKVRELIEPWVAERYTDQQIADLLNDRGVPTLTFYGSWSAGKVEALRRRLGLRSMNGRNHIQQRFNVPPGHDAHCNTCDGPVDYSWLGKAVLHKRLTTMLVAGVRQVGRCEGSGEPVVVRPIPMHAGAVALAA